MSPARISLGLECYSRAVRAVEAGHELGIRNRRIAPPRGAWRGTWAGRTRSSASTMAESSPCASGSTCCSIPDSFHEIGALAGRAKYGADGEIAVLSAGQFRVRARSDRGPPGRGRRRRFHRARRRRRCLDPRQAGAVRADGERAALAAGAADRRHRRRRLGQDHRDRGLHLRAGQSGLGLGGEEHGHRAGRGARPRLGRGARRGAPCHQPLFGDGRGHLAHVHRRAAGGGAAQRADHQGRAWRRRHSRARGRRG